MAHSLNICIPPSCGNPQIDAIWCELNKLRQYVYSNSGGSGGACCVESVNGKTGVVVLTTADIQETVNLYYTDNRVRIYGDARWALKNHTHVLGDIIDFPNQAGQNGKVLFTNGVTPYWSDVPPTYTDEKAQDAFASLIANGNHSGISFTYDDALNRMNVIVTSAGANAGGAFQLAEYIVGDVGAPSVGSTTYANELLSGKETNNLLVFVDGLKLTPNRTDRFSYNISGNTITFTAGLPSGTAVAIYILNGQPNNGTVTTTTTVVPSTTTTTTTAPIARAYFGVRNVSDGTAVTSNEILSGTQNTQNPASAITVNYTPLITPGSPKFCWIAVPVPHNKTQWYISVLNNGSMGTSSDFFGVRQTVSVNGTNYYVWVTSYATETDAPCQFS